MNYLQDPKAYAASVLLVGCTIEDLLRDWRDGALPGTGADFIADTVTEMVRLHDDAQRALVP